MIQALKQAGLALFALGGIVAWYGFSKSGLLLSRHRRLDMSFHNVPPKERNADPMQTFNTNEMQLMQSPCRPESGGYFGSTSGLPFEIQYGFEMETTDGNTENILQEIEEEIIDVVLSSSFPSLCGFRRRNEMVINRDRQRQNQETAEMSLTTGFHFGMELHDAVDLCDPQVDPTNACTVHVSPVSIFGTNLQPIGQDVLMQITNTLRDVEHKYKRDGLVRLTVIDQFTKLSDGNRPEYPEGGGLSPGVKTAVALSTIALVACLAAILLYIIVDRRSNSSEQSFISPIPTKGKRKNGLYSTKTDRSEEGSNITDTVGFQDGPSVVLGEGGRPVIIEFQNEQYHQGMDPNMDLISNGSDKDSIHFSKPSNYSDHDHGSRGESIKHPPHGRVQPSIPKSTGLGLKPPRPPQKANPKVNNPAEPDGLWSDGSYYSEEIVESDCSLPATNPSTANRAAALWRSLEEEPYDENSITDASRLSRSLTRASRPSDNQSAKLPEVI